MGAGFYYLMMGFIIVFFGYLAWTKPVCNADTVPMFAFGNGWICVQGYKP